MKRCIAGVTALAVIARLRAIHHTSASNAPRSRNTRSKSECSRSRSVSVGVTLCRQCDEDRRRGLGSVGQPISLDHAPVAVQADRQVTVPRLTSRLTNQARRSDRAQGIVSRTKIRPAVAMNCWPSADRGRPVTASSPPKSSTASSPARRAEHEGAQHRDRVRRGAVEMPGDLAGGIEAGNRRAAAQHPRAVVGRNPAERVGDGADQRIGQERRLEDRPRPVRLRRLKLAASRQARRSAWRRTCRDRRSPPRRSSRPCRSAPAGRCRACRASSRQRVAPRSAAPRSAPRAASPECRRAAGRGWRRPRGPAVEMQRARKRLPGLVHQAAALVEEAAAGFVHHDAVGIDQHHRRGIAGCADRSARCACRSNRRTCRRPAPSAMRMPSPVLKRVPGEIRRMPSAPGPKCSRIMSGLAWKPPAARITASAGTLARRALARDLDAADAAAFADEALHRRRIADRDAGRLRRARQRLDDRRAAADRLDARRTLGEIIGRLMEFDAVALDPRHGRRRLGGEPREIGFVALEFGRLQHVVDEARLDAVGRGHAHVGRRPAGVAAGLASAAFSSSVTRSARPCCRAASRARRARRASPAAPWPTTTRSEGAAAMPDLAQRLEFGAGAVLRRLLRAAPAIAPREKVTT